MNKTTSIALGAILSAVFTTVAAAEVPFPENTYENGEIITTTQEIITTTDPGTLALTIGITGIATGFIITILTFIISCYLFHRPSNNQKKDEQA